jgi:hypothetical protein
LFGLANKYGRSPGGNASPGTVDALDVANALLVWPAARDATDDEVREAYPRLVERVRSISDPAGRRPWLDLARAQPDREAPKNLLKEISK